MKSSWSLDFILKFLTISVIMRKNSSFTEFGEIRRKSSNNLLGNSRSSSKYASNHLRFSLNQFQTASLRPAKGFSFGGSQRNSLMDINVVSPSAKYNIKGLVEINLNQKKGPSIGTGREDSIEKTPLSYIKNNSNVTIKSLSLGQPLTHPTKTISNPTLLSRLAKGKAKTFLYNFWTARLSAPIQVLEHTLWK